MAEFYATLLRKKQTEKDTEAKRQRSRNIATSALSASQHAGRQPTVLSAFSRVSAGDAEEAIAALFFGADIPRMIINSQLRKDVVKVPKAAPASYAGLNRDRLLATATSAAHAPSPPQPRLLTSRPRQAVAAGEILKNATYFGLGKIRKKMFSRPVFATGPCILRSDTLPSRFPLEIPSLVVYDRRLRMAWVAGVQAARLCHWPKGGGSREWPRHYDDSTGRLGWVSHTWQNCRRCAISSRTSPRLRCSKWAAARKAARRAVKARR